MPLARSDLYRAAYAYHRLFQTASWLLGGAFLLSGALLLAPRLYPTLPWAGRLAIPADTPWRIAATWALLLGLWLLLPAWHSRGFRAAARVLARAVRSLRHWAGRSWRPALLALVLAAALLWAYAWAVGDLPGTRRELLDPDVLGRIVALAALLALGRAALRARRRFIILAFTDHSGEPRLAPAVEGLAELLLNRLASLSDLYRTLDDARPRATEGKIDAAISVGEIDDSLQGAVSADSKVSLGFLQIPLGPILATAGRIVHGPRLTGSLHRRGEELVLVGKLQGGGLAGNWSVSSAEAGRPAGGEAALSALPAMVDQLACRIFTSLMEIGSPRWQAVAHYSQGLRAYRETQRTRKERRLRLREAEKAFIQSLAEDEKFAQCHYNLGIVYRDLGENDAALAAFRQALAEDRRDAQAGYALASLCASLGRYRDAVLLCDEVVRREPVHASAWSLRDLMRRLLLEQELGRRLSPGEQPELWRRGLADREIAAALAWRSLCRAVAAGRDGRKESDVAATCLRNLAVALAMSNQPRAQAVFRQALAVAPGDAELQLELGKTLYHFGRPAEAAAALYAALAGERPDLWGWLAEVEAERGKRARDEREQREARRAAAEACQHALAAPSQADEETRERVAGVWHKLGEEERASRVEAIPTVLAELAMRPGGEPAADYRRRLEQERQQHDGWDWAAAQCALRLADLAAEGSEERQSLLEEALRRLEGEHPGEVVRERLHMRLSELCLRRRMLDRALHHAERAVARNPEGAAERAQLGYAHWELANFERAEQEWRTSLNLDPSPETLQNIALTYWNRSAALGDVARRRLLLTQMAENFRHALDLMESEPLAADRAAEQVLARAALHFRLGITYQELLDHQAAIGHLKVADAMGWKPLESKVRLGFAYLRNRSYNEAEETFARALAEARARLREAVAAARAAAGGQNPPRRVATAGLIASGAGEELPIASLIAEVYLYSAYSFAERGVNLEQALARIARARRRIDRFDPAARAAFLGAYHDVLGWVRFQMGRVREAAAELERAVSIRADNYVYFRLAKAYRACADGAGAGGRAWLAKSREACLHARRSDRSGDLAAEIEELLGQLDAAEAAAAEPARIVSA